ncbi:MAG TPA: alpha-amylase family glycosyl hydrolase [Chloroflexia bacterium]|nr:alpha-amylase family glycosyl hydrolase [Chloroflexia bacterium]
MKLTQLHDYLAHHGPVSPDYAIPPRWAAGYVGPRAEQRGIIQVDPYAYYAQALAGILARAEARTDYGRSLATLRGENDAEWLSKAVVYGAFVRSATAYDHDLDGQIAPAGSGGAYTETGTFLKLIAYLPQIQSFGVDTLYLLPVTKYSNVYRKGEVGSPYSVKSFTDVEPSYHDSLLGTAATAGDEFAALVEACHILGLRVMLDFIPRTASRDNDLLLQHPDWFYWIKAAELPSFGPPPVAGLGFEQPRSATLGQIYAQPAVQAHLARFAPDPQTTHPAAWPPFVAAHGQDPDVLEQIARQFGVITPPAFSDWINDTQPPWDDVTFLRLYMDHPAESQAYLPAAAAQAPYMLFDVAKSSVFPGTQPNAGLWEFILNIIPHWQRTYGIDGARLDMGHALPKGLERRIIATATATDPAFAFLAEELAMANDRKSKAAGYHAFLGNSWQTEHQVQQGLFWGLVEWDAPRLVLPILAAAEIADSPRAVMRPGGSQLARAYSIMNYFLVNTLPYINAGQEIYERQPMNLGLDHPEGSRYALDPGDPFYGKLAFFDICGLHWNGRDDLVPVLQAAGALRRTYADLLSPQFFHFYSLKHHEAFAYFYWTGTRGLLLVVNANAAEPLTASVNIGPVTWRATHRVTQHFDNNLPALSTFAATDGQVVVTLNGGEATVFTIE